MLADMARKETDLAYAAAFLDADGCVSISQGRITKAGYRTYAISVMVSQKTPDVPYWFASLFGGSVKLRMPSKSSRHAGRFCPMHTWSLYSSNASMFLQLIIPYLKTKRVRAEAGVQLMALHGMRGRKGIFGTPKAISLEEAQERESLAMLIRNENMQTSSRCQPITQTVM